MKVLEFVPFDPATKMSEAMVEDPLGGKTTCRERGVHRRRGPDRPSPDAAAASKKLEGKGYRVLAVASGLPNAMKLVGLIALSDPPRPDSTTLIAELLGLGVTTVWSQAMRRRLQPSWRMPWDSMGRSVRQDLFPAAFALNIRCLCRRAARGQV